MPASAAAAALLAVAAAALADEAEMHRPWKMHHVNNQYLIANSLNTADVDKDGYLDYSIIDEYLGVQTIVFHPGKGGDLRKEWPRVDLGKTGNPEYSCLGDLDGDGSFDLVVVEGDDLERGYRVGVLGAGGGSCVGPEGVGERRLHSGVDGIAVSVLPDVRCGW